jgi:hypothetical protein
MHDDAAGCAGEHAAAFMLESYTRAQHAVKKPLAFREVYLEALHASSTAAGQ